MNELNQLENAINCYDKSIELNPVESSLYYDKALMLIKLEKFKEAIPVLEKVIELDPKNHSASGELGRLKIIKNYYLK